MASAVALLDTTFVTLAVGTFDTAFATFAVGAFATRDFEEVDRVLTSLASAKRCGLGEPRRHL